MIKDCCCSFADVSKLNTEYLYPKLRSLTKTQFFRYFRVRLCGTCPFRFPSPACGSPECAVCECKKEQLPCDRSGKCYLETPKSGACSRVAKETAKFGRLDRAIAGDFKPANDYGKKETNWLEGEETDGATYVDLIKNPEQWTGYTSKQGSSKIWEAIYKENCFGSAEDIVKPARCREERVFDRVISGMHTSISAHLLAKSCLKQASTGECLTWGVNLPEFKARISDHPRRIENLYFVYLFTLRAVLKAGPQLKSYDFDAGNETEAIKARTLLGDLLTHAVQADRPCLSVTATPFDETTLFQGSKSSMMPAVKAALGNISTIMDCVGCDKCKLWGKLQTTGIGVALKLLFEQESAVLSRNEVIALVNTLARFSASIHEVEAIMSSSDASEAELYSRLHGMSLDDTQPPTEHLVGKEEEL